MVLILQIAIGVALAPVIWLTLVTLASGARTAGEFIWFMFTNRATIPAAVGLLLALILWLTQFF